MFWYEYPSWTKHPIRATGSWTTDMQVGDVDNDGDVDVIIPNDSGLQWYENPRPAGDPRTTTWTEHLIGTDGANNHDVEVGDVDGDGALDVVTRKKAGGWTYLWRQDNPTTWTQITVSGTDGEGTALADLDGDGDLDIVHNGFWVEQIAINTWVEHTIDSSWADDVGVLAVDIDDDGNLDVVLAPSESSGRFSWYETSDPVNGSWIEHTIDPAVSYLHTFKTGDLDGDGDTDIHLGSEWLRQESNQSFTTQDGVPVTGGVPDRVVLADIDGDGDLDVVIGVEFGQRLIWGESSAGGQTWTEHLIATDVDYFSVDAADIDRAGDIDVVGGTHQGNGEVYIYENLGDGSAWITHTVDPGDSSLIDHHDGTRLVDMDLDGDLDILSIGRTKKSVVIYENLAIGGGDLDLTPPTLTSVIAIGDPNQVTVTFSEPVDPITAEASDNYSISSGIDVTDASLDPAGRMVTLTTSTLTDGATYTLTVDTVEDLAGNPISPGSQMDFVFVQDPQDMVAYWPMDEGTGTTTQDASGHGHTGTLVNGPQWWIGTGLGFDGVDDHVDVGTFDVSGSALTLAAWIYPENLANCVLNDCRILSKATGTAESDHYFMLSTIESGGVTRLRFRLKTEGSTSTLIASSGDLPESTWVHAAAVYDGTDMQLYLNGTLVGSLGKSGSLTGNPSVPVWIGGNPPGSTERPWAGGIDEVRIYDRALSAGELQLLPPPGSGVIFRGDFESGNTSAWSVTVP